MAKVLFTAIVAEVTGRLSGSVFQKSVGGNILRSLPLPINRRTQLQQRNRAALVGATSAWRNCSPTDHLSWDGDTNRERFNNYTSFNFEWMWLSGGKSCTPFSPSPANVPEPDTAWYAFISDGTPFFLGFSTEDQSYANQYQWFIRMSKPRQSETDPVGEMIGYRALTVLESQDNQVLIAPSLQLIDFPDSWILDYWIDWEIVVNTGSTRGTTGIITSQIISL